MDTFSLEAIVDEMAEIQTLERKTFEEKIKHSVLIGQLFDAIVSEEQEANQGLTPNSVYDKYEPLLAPIVGKTIMVNECHVLYLAGEANRKRVLKKYREVGLGKDKLKADGSVPLRIDYLATAIRADLD